MARAQELRVELVAASGFQVPSGVSWIPDADASDAEGLVEFAGRACYESFDRPNPHTATTASYVRHVIEVGHHLLLEHASATMYIRGISRAAAEELKRHRHFSVSELSQRYIPEAESEVIVPAIIAEDEELRRLFTRAVDDSRFVYEELLAALAESLAQETNALLRRKKARQAARAILPQATESRLVVTGNMRTWRHFVAQRATEHADVEIRSVALACLQVLQQDSPHLWADFQVMTLADGTAMATCTTPMSRLV